MPAAPQNSTILVTGASGYIAAWTVKQLLERGFSVRGTVRSTAKGEYLSKLFKEHGDKWSFVIVEDVEQEGGFDEAVKGVQGVAHIASPFHFKAEDPYKDLINPAVNGTLSILKSAKSHGTDVKRIVITSSYASFLVPKDPVYTFSEKDWNTHSPKVVEEQGKDAPQVQSYSASKVLAERAAWKFVEDEKPSFDIATINPSLVLGPIIHQVDKASSLNTSVHQFYDYLIGEKSAEGSAGPAGSSVDVRDVAAAHVEALVREPAGGNRFAANKLAYTWQQVLDIVNNGPAASDWPKVPKGQPGAGKDVKQNILDASKSEKVLGIKYHSFEDTITDMAASLKERSKNW